MAAAQYRRLSRKFDDTALVLPTEEFFPDRGLKGRAGVAALFRRVRDHAGMADWPCTVEAEEGEPRARARAAAADGPAESITYRRGELDSGALVAHFARELARYLITTIEEPAPGGETLREAAVELAAGFIGFGLFMANAAARHAMFHLNEGELAHALAMFCLLRRSPPESADDASESASAQVRAPRGARPRAARSGNSRSCVAWSRWSPMHAECTLPTRARLRFNAASR